MRNINKSKTTYKSNIGSNLFYDIRKYKKMAGTKNLWIFSIFIMFRYFKLFYNLLGVVHVGFR